MLSRTAVSCLSSIHVHQLISSVVAPRSEITEVGIQNDWHNAPQAFLDCINWDPSKFISGRSTLIVSTQCVSVVQQIDLALRLESRRRFLDRRTRRCATYSLRSHPVTKTPWSSSDYTRSKTMRAVKMLVEFHCTNYVIMILSAERTGDRTLGQQR